MDPISTSTFNLSIHRQDEETEKANFLGSTKSLSKFEQKNFKTLFPQFLATIVSLSNHIVVGLALAFSAVLIPQLEAKNSDIAVTKSEISWVASVLALVAPFGCLLSGWMMDKFGRLNTLKISIIPGILGWVLIAVAQNIPMLILGRIISGLATTLSTSPSIVYVTEIARKDIRGSFLAIGPTYVSLGMVIAYLKGWLMGWRTIAWLVNIYLIVPFFLIFLLPESPIWLISQGRTEEAKKSLNWLHKHQQKSEGQTKSFAEMQLSLLLKEDEQKKREARIDSSNKFKEMLKPSGYKPLLILCGIFFCQQFSGIYIFLFYSVTFFEDVGTTVNAYIASILIGVIRLIMSLVNTWMLKFFGRRPLIMISATGMAFSMFVSGLFTLWIKNGTTELTWVPVVFLLLYVVFSMVGLLTIPWTMTAELFPLKIRSTAHSISTSIVNFVMFLAVQNYHNLSSLFGGSAGVQWFFALLSILTVIYIFIFMPETHRKKLSEIEEYFKYNTIYLRQKKIKDAVLDNNRNQERDDNSVVDKLINKV